MMSVLPMFLEMMLLLTVVNVLVGTDAGGFERLGAQLLIFVGDHVDAAGELVDICALAAEVENADLRVGHTTVEAGLRVWLYAESCCQRLFLRVRHVLRHHSIILPLFLHRRRVRGGRTLFLQ